VNCAEQRGGSNAAAAGGGGAAAAAAEWDEEVQLDLMQFVARMGITAPPVMIAVSSVWMPEICPYSSAQQCKTRGKPLAS
jgi:hypothetical protein